MATVTHRGKKQDKSLEGSIRVEYDNGRVVYTLEGVIRRIDDALATYYYNEDGDLIAVNGIQTDGRVALSNFDPTTGNEIYRNGKLPDDSYGWIVAKDGESIQDAFT
jgi:hypothetical protein